MRAASCTILCFAALVAGCEATANRVAKQDPQIYRRILDVDPNPPSLGADGALSLTEALAFANHASETLDIQGESLVRAILERHRAVAAFLPTVSASPGYTIREKVAGNSGGGIVGGTGTGTGTGGVVVGGGSSSGGGSSGGIDADLNVPIDARIVLFDGNQNVNRYWQNVYLVEQQREQLLEAQETLLFDVANVYYTVLSAQERVRVLENSITVQQERLRDTRGRQSAGVARPLDVAQTEAQFAATRVQLIEAQRQVSDGRSLLAYLINAHEIEAVPFSDGYTPGEALSPVATLLETARRHRSELTAADRAIDAAERAVRAAIGRYYPSLTLDLSVFLYRESIPTERTWESLLELSFPIFSGGTIDADVREAWSFFREAQLVARQSRRRVTREVEQGYRDVEASRDRLAELRVQLDAATESFRQAEAVYQAGRGTNLERVTAQDAELQAELGLVTEAINGKLLRLSLLRSTGVLREALLEPGPSTMPTTAPSPSQRASGSSDR